MINIQGDYKPPEIDTVRSTKNTQSQPYYKTSAKKVKKTKKSMVIH